MTSTFTPNIQLEEPARGDDVGTWDTPVNNNMTLIDLVAGGIASIALTNANVILSAAQFQCNRITFSGALSGSVTITFPTSFVKPYIIQNATTNTSAFTVTCATTAAGANVICLQPGELSQIYNSGANIRHIGLNPPIGGYWDYAGSSVPNWVSGCTQPPFLPCDGTTFSSAIYPTLTQILGTTTLPDRRGTAGITLNQGTNRYTTAGSGVDGNTRFTVGGDQLLQSHTHTTSVGTESANHTHTLATGSQIVVGLGSASFAGGGSNNTPTTASVIGPNTGIESASHNHVVTVNAGGSGGSQNVAPVTVTGIMMIRAI